MDNKKLGSLTKKTKAERCTCVDWSSSEILKQDWLHVKASSWQACIWFIVVLCLASSHSIGCNEKAFTKQNTSHRLSVVLCVFQTGKETPTPPPNCMYRLNALRLGEQFTSYSALKCKGEREEKCKQSICDVIYSSCNAGNGRQIQSSDPVWSVPNGQ